MPLESGASLLEQPRELRRILLSWGFEGEELESTLAAVLDPEGPRCLVLDIGTTALDVKRKGDFHGHKYMGGLALVGLDNKVIGHTDEKFVEPSEDFLEGGHAGGIGNAANAVGKVLENEAREHGTLEWELADTRHHIWELMARMGTDRVAKIFGDKIHALVGKELLAPQPGNLPSGLSDVFVQAKKRGKTKKGDRVIFFRAGASGTMVLGKDDLLQILIRQPKNAHISYPGLFPNGMDQNNGVILKWFLEEAKKVSPIVSFDVHGFTKLHHVEPALGTANMVNANLAEAAKIFLGDEIDTAQEPEGKEKKALLQRLTAALTPYLQKGSGPAMFTISDRGGCFLLFRSAQGEVQTKYVASSCGQIPAHDKTGAGDVRYAFQRLYVARQMCEAWENGSFAMEDAERAVQIGQIATTLHVQGKEANAFEDVTMAKIERVAREGGKFGNLKSLRKALVGNRGGQHALSA